MQRIAINSLEDLEKFAYRLAATLKGGEVVGLVGDLGAGKTTFVQLLSKALGVTTAVKSPTFILMQVLETDPAASTHGVARLCHVDAYRLKDWSELAAIGFEEYAGERHTVALVEWADRVPELHGMAGYKEITFGFVKAETRLLTVEGFSGVI